MQEEAQHYDSIPIRKSVRRRIRLIQAEKTYITAGADKEGIIPIDEYIRRTTVILNSRQSKGR